MGVWEDTVGPTRLTEEDRRRNRLARLELSVSPEIKHEIHSYFSSQYHNLSDTCYMSKREIIRVLRDLREGTSFPVKPGYSQMPADELRAYLGDIKKLAG